MSQKSHTLKEQKLHYYYYCPWARRAIWLRDRVLYYAVQRVSLYEERPFTLLWVLLERAGTLIIDPDLFLFCYFVMNYYLTIYPCICVVLLPSLRVYADYHWNSETQVLKRRNCYYSINWKLLLLKVGGIKLLSTVFYWRWRYWVTFY